LLVSTITRKLLNRFSQNSVVFGVNPDLDPDPGFSISLAEFLPLWATAVSPDRWVVVFSEFNLRA